MYIGKVINNIEKKFSNHSFKRISFNSKNCKTGDIFFSIKGKNVDGNLYIKDAINNGAKTIISEQNFQGFKKDVLFIKNTTPRKLLSEVSNRLYKFATSLVGNRVFDLYLKYMGIKALTTALMVFATAFGTAMFGILIDNGFSIEQISTISCIYISISLVMLFAIRNKLNPTIK